MTIYSVHAPEGDVGAVEQVALVKEGFCWPALFVAPLWLVYHGQWLGLLAYVAGSVAIGLALVASGTPEDTSGLFWLIYHLVVAMHANDWRRWRLEAAGLDLVGVISGQSLEIAEARWFSEHVPTRDPEPSRPMATGATVRGSAGRGLTPFATPFDSV